MNGRPKGWAWARIKRDEVADLNLRCDPAGKTGWIRVSMPAGTMPAAESRRVSSPIC